MNDAQTAAAILARATALLSAGPSDDALDVLSNARVRFADDVAIAGRYADALQLARRVPEAIAAYRDALELDVTHFESWYGLGGACLAQGAHADARDALTRAVALKPEAAGARCALAEALFELGLVERAVAEYRAVVARGNNAVRRAALAGLACIVPGCPSAGNADVLALRRDWARTITEAITPLPRRAPPIGRKLRIAYVSAFFGSRNWMKPVFGVINRHDRERFEIHMVCDGAVPSAEAGYVDHDLDCIWPVRGLSNSALAQRLAQAEIDVLVDLNGYSFQDRLGLIACRPARLQLGWFNMFATTGMPGFDALIGDASAIDPQEERFYSERILRVPGSYLAFEVRYQVPDVAAPPCVTSKRVTFGCLGSAYKLTDLTLDLWARIACASPAARLLVKSPALDQACNRAELLTRLSQRGLSAERCVLKGGDEHCAFLREYDNVDIALDTFPYNGGTTTTEALWQGVPVLTYDGDRWAGRTSRSLLSAAGLDEFVARDAADFVRKAIALANDPDTPAMLARLRASMRARLAASAACDTLGLCRALEAIYVGGLAQSVGHAP